MQQLFWYMNNSFLGFFPQPKAARTAFLSCAQEGCQVRTRQKPAPPLPPPSILQSQSSKEKTVVFQLAFPLCYPVGLEEASWVPVGLAGSDPTGDFEGILPEEQNYKNGI